MRLAQDKEDRIYNALVIGMALEDAYIYAGLNEDEIVAVNSEDFYQLKWRRLIKEFEYSLLSDLRSIAQKQVKMGKESATTWMLEKMFPRYSNKPQSDTGQVHLHFNNIDPAGYDTVEVFEPEEEGGDE